MSRANLLRKASDLIKTESQYYVNVNPDAELKVGAYGEVKLETGEFVTEGNIYDQTWIPDAGAHPPERGEVKPSEAIKSAQILNWDLGDGSSLNDVVKESTGFALEITNGKRAAFVIMENSQTLTIPAETVLHKLSSVKEIAYSWLITEVVECSSYVLGLTPIAGGVPLEDPLGRSTEASHVENQGVSLKVSPDDTDVVISKAKAEATTTRKTPYALLYKVQKMRLPWRRKLTGNYYTGFRGPWPKDDPTINETNAWAYAETPWVTLLEDTCEEDVPYDEIM